MSFQLIENVTNLLACIIFAAMVWAVFEIIRPIIKKFVLWICGDKRGHCEPVMWDRMHDPLSISDFEAQCSVCQRRTEIVGVCSLFPHRDERGYCRNFRSET